MNNTIEKKEQEVLSYEHHGHSLQTIDNRKKKKLYIESYGCQMNFSDSEIVASIMSKIHFDTENNIECADAIFLNTCSIRENAETKIRQRLKDFTKLKLKKPELIIGILGCMAERLKSKFLEEEKIVDIVAGPDSYKDLPNLIADVDDGKRAINVLLSREETYADINPIRLNSNGVSAFISIMRGCDNMCSFCVVPFTRGRERSRDVNSIVEEAEKLFFLGYREVTLLGQNVDSYKWKNPKDGTTCNFAQLLKKVAEIHPLLRIRFSTSHPKDMTNEVLETIATYDNICKYIHLPVQSGSSRILDLMRRGYTREWYLEKIESIRRIIPECAVSTDIIAGFCTETDEDHTSTLSVMDKVKFDFAYMFKYSERPGTPAAKRMADDVSEEMKTERLNAIIQKQKEHSLFRMQHQVGRIHRVLIERLSKKSDQDFFGRNTQNAAVVFPRLPNYKAGDYVDVMVHDCTSATLLGEIV